MAESLTSGKHDTVEEDNNSRITNDKGFDDDARGVKPSIVKFDILTDRQLRIPNLCSNGETSDSYSATDDENNYGLTLSQCDCCPETIAIPDDSDKINAEIKADLPPAVKEWILQTQNRIAKFENDQDMNIHKTVGQEIKAMMDRQEVSCRADFESKVSNESHDELENDENRDPNNDNVKDNFQKTSPSKLPMTRNSCKGTKRHAGIAMKEIQITKGNDETTPISANEGKMNEKKYINQMNSLKYLLSAFSNMTSKIEESQMEPKQETTIARTAKLLPNDIMTNIFDAKVALERFPPFSLPSVTTPNSKRTSINMPKVQIRSDRPSKIPKKGQALNFRRYCVTCQATINRTSKEVDRKCSKCSTVLIFVCADCEDQFENYNNLSYHRRTKCSVKKLFNCEFCKYKSPVKYNIKIHIGRRHSNQESTIKGCTEVEQKPTPKKHRMDCEDSKKSEVGDNVKVEMFRGSLPSLDAKFSADTKSIERNCPKCRKTIKAALLENCPGCSSPLEFTCLRCQDVFSKQNCIVHHLNNNCDESFRELMFHCSNCIRLPRDTKNCQFCPYKGNAIFNLIEHLKLYHIMTTPCTGAGKTNALRIARKRVRE